MSVSTRSLLILVLPLLLVLAGCAPPDLTDIAAQQATSPSQEEPASEPTPEPVREDASAATSPTQTPLMGRGMGGPGHGMMRFHHASIPAEYAELTNPVTADAESLERGEAQYTTLCATCHGDTGMGEGAAGQALNPPASPIAQTSRMMSDAYLFWRVTEGGIPFETAMPAWGETLDVEARWDVINYIRNMDAGGRLGRGPGAGRGQQGQGMNEAEHHAAILAAAIEQDLITEEDADLFLAVHAVLDEHYRSGEVEMDAMPTSGKQSMQRAMTGQAVRDGYITQEEADRFTEIHDKLLEAGLM